MSADVSGFWEAPPAIGDQTPLVSGGAVLVMRLSPEEVETLLRRAPTLPEAVHDLLRVAAAVWNR